VWTVGQTVEIKLHFQILWRSVDGAQQWFSLFYYYLSGEEPVAKSVDNIVGVVAGILGALILIVIIIIAVLLYKR